MYDMRAYLGTDSCSTTDEMTATHATVTHLTSRVEGLGHKIIMGNFFWTPRLFDDLDRSKYIFVGQCSLTEKTCPVTLGPKQLKLKRDDIRVRTR